jgi:hypothetical protein
MLSAFDIKQEYLAIFMRERVYWNCGTIARKKEKW